MTSVAEAASQAQEAPGRNGFLLSQAVEDPLVRCRRLECLLSSEALEFAIAFAQSLDPESDPVDIEDEEAKADRLQVEVARRVARFVVEHRALQMLWSHEMWLSTPAHERTQKKQAADIKRLVKALPNSRAVNLVISELAGAIAPMGEVLTPERALELAWGLSLLRKLLRTGAWQSSEANYQIAKARARLNEQCDNCRIPRPPAA